jgi:methyl-accepting chemotaxis protein
MRFSDLKIKTKIMTGALALVLITVIFGGLAYTYIGKVSSALIGITDRDAKAVEYATGVERMALNTIMEEKNYLISQSDEAHLRAEQNVKELNSFLDKVDEIARANNIDTLLEKSKIARSETSKYAEKYREGVKSIKENRDAVKEMVRTGNIVGDAAAKFLSMQVSAYTKAQKDGADPATLDKYVQRYIITTNIYELALKIMRAEKEEVNYKDRKAYASMQKMLPELMELYNKLEKITTDPSETQLIKDARTATLIYEKAAASWIKNDDNLNLILQSMSTMGLNVIKQAQAAEEAGYKKLEDAKTAAQATSAEADTIIISTIAIAIVLGLAIAFWLASIISRPIIKGVTFAKAVAEGDFNQTLDINQKDEIGVLADALRTMVKELKNKIEYADGVINGITVPCVIGDSSGNILLANQPVIDFFEKNGSPKDFVGTSMGFFAYNDKNKKTITQQALEEKRIIKMDRVEMKTTTGKEKIVNVDASPIYDYNHNVVAGITLFNDVTEVVLQQKLAEKAKAEGMLQAAQQLESVVEIVTSASEQLSAQIEQSSRGSEEQARSISETATAMEEMNATVLEVAKNASNAAGTADQAKTKAEEGARAVSQVVKGIGQVQNQSQEMKIDMDNLGKQAEGIGQILNVISDIADQTNLLALNAAIEAARAGDAGRGFAVVADEVRKLAEKTMTATKEVGSAIRGIQDGTKKNIENVERTGKNIEEVTSLATNSGDALRQIVTLAEKTTDQVRSIATASEQQSATSEEINRSIESVNRISSETADGMRQSAQAVTELADQAQVLKQLIDEMKSDGGSSSTALPSGKKILALGRG